MNSVVGHMGSLDGHMMGRGRGRGDVGAGGRVWHCYGMTATILPGW